MTDEEGARFGIACAGSRLLTGALDADRARALRDDGGTTLAEAMAAAGRDPAALGRDDETLRRVGTFVELHVEQGRGASPTYGAPSGLRAASGRTAGGASICTARRTMPARPGWSTVETRCPTSRAPCSPRAVGPSSTGPWRRSAGCGSSRAARTRCPPSCRPGSTRGLPTRPTVRAVVDGVARAAGTAAHEESWTPVVEFEAGLRDRLAALLGDAPVLATGAGHDAGILASAGGSRRRCCSSATRPACPTPPPSTPIARRLPRRRRGARAVLEELG